MLKIDSLQDLMHLPMLPKMFEFEGQVFRISGSSANSLIDMLTGQTRIGFTSFRSEDKVITLWAGLLNDCAIHPFCVIEGEDRKTLDEAIKNYESLTAMGMTPKGVEA